MLAHLKNSCGFRKRQNFSTCLPSPWNLVARWFDWRAVCKWKDSIKKPIIASIDFAKTSLSKGIPQTTAMQRFADTWSCDWFIKYCQRLLRASLTHILGILICVCPNMSLKLTHLVYLFLVVTQVVSGSVSPWENLFLLCFFCTAISLLLVVPHCCHLFAILILFFIPTFVLSFL